MGSSIDHDDKTSCEKGKIHDVRIDRNLLPEFVTLRLQLSQLPPKSTFRVGAVTAKLARELSGH